MEFVGKSITKEFKGFGVFEGVVQSYDSSTGFFKIVYEDGDSEEADLFEVSRLISSSSSSCVEANSIVEKKKPVTAKKAGRKPKKRRRNGPGKSYGVLEGDDSNNADNSQLGCNVVNNSSGCVIFNGDLNGGNSGLDLNRELDFDDGVENAGVRRGIDLNLTVNDDGLNEDDSRIGKVSSLAETNNVRGFDLNLGANEESGNGANGIVDINVTVAGLGDEVKNGVVSGVVDVNCVNSSDCDAQGRGSEACTPDQCQDGTSGRRKRRRGGKNLKSPADTVLRRSARRAKALADDENNGPHAIMVNDPNDLSMSGITDDIEEKPVPKMLKTPMEPQVPPKIELPLSSSTLDLEGIPVLDLFCVYSCLRSFSTILYLSPFGLVDFVAALKSRVSNQLLDLIHVSILLTLRKHLDFLASEGCESASACLRNLNWDLLDVITWPVFMVEYLLLHGSGLKPEFTFSHLKLFDGEYYKQPAEVKIEMLRCLCDDVVEVDAIRSELTKRKLMAEANMEVGKTMCSGRKRKTSVEAPGDSCLSEDMKEEIADGNSDECCLCKMDGNLICCDGCPAAYHSKCVGIVSSLLPEGDWFCPECAIGRLNKKSVRGAELLGTDPYGRLFFSCFDYLLVSDSDDAEALCNYYHKDDLGAVIQLLRSCSIQYGSILSAISQHWAFLPDFRQPKSDMESKPCIEADNLLTNSEGFGEVLQESGSIQKSGGQVSDIVAGGATIKQRKKKGSARRGRPPLKAKEEDILQEQSEDNYVNSYSFALTASSVVEELLRKPSGKVSIDGPKTEEEIISIQLKFILNKSTKPCWTTIQDLNKEGQRETCGWCYCCRFPVEERGCLFNVKNGIPIPDALKVEIEDMLSKKNKKGHLVDVICYIICMEERLRGFLVGPWLRPQYSELWRKRVLKASDVLSLKPPLLMLESNLRPLALSADWWKHVDLVTTMGSATHYVASSRATSKNGISRKKVRGADSKSKSSTAGLVFFWWRGGRTSRSLFNWKVIPHSLAMKVARKAGCMKIPEIQYPDASENVRRTKCFAWRAAVETCTSIEQLALQVREFDLFIRWNDIENTHPQSLLDKGSIKSIRLFKKVIIRRKRVDGGVAKYLLDFGKRRSVPDVVLKHGQKFEESNSERKKYWLDEGYVPLYLLKSFEERKISRNVAKTKSSKLWKSGKVTKKPLREKGLNYLFSRAEKADSYQCGHCNKNVPISDAVSCQLCNGYFHKRHVMKSSEGIATGCTYTCHRCRAGKYVKKESNLGKRKLSHLRDPKLLKAKNEGHCSTLMVKPTRKRGRPANSKRQVFLRNAKKMSSQEQTSLQKNADVSIGINLRRSARKANCTTVYSSRFAKGTMHSSKSAKGTVHSSKSAKGTVHSSKSAKGTVHSTKYAKGKKRKSNRLRKVESKEISKSFPWKKKRTHVLHSFWINGLLLSMKSNDERVVQFKRRKLLAPSEFFTETDDQLKCSLCSRQASTSSFMYIACEICGDWFHGDAFGLNKENIKSLIGFKCHMCRQKSPPACPFVDVLRDNGIVFNGSEACEAEESPDAVVHKEAIDVQGLQCNEGCGLVEAYTAQNCVGTLDEDETAMLDSELILENESHTCKEVASCLVESQDVNLGAKLLKEACEVEESPDAVVHKEAINVQGLQCNEGYGLLEARTAQNCVGTLDEDETAMLDSELILENESHTCKEVASCSVESQDVNLGAKLLKEHDGNSISEGHSGFLEVPTAQICSGTLDQDETQILDSELRVETESFTCKKSASSSFESQDVNLGAKLPKESNGISMSEDPCFLVVHTAQVCNGALDQDDTLMVESELTVEPESLTCKEVSSCSVGNHDVNLAAKVSDDSSISEGPSDHTMQNCIGTPGQDDTTMLDSELTLENESRTCKEVASCSVESQDVNLGAKFLKEPDGPSGFLEVHTAQICDGSLDQDETKMLDSELKVENESFTCKDIASCSVESQDVNLRGKLLKESDVNSTSKGPSGLLEFHTAENCDGTELRAENESLTCKEIESCSVESEDVNLQAKVLKEGNQSTS